MNIFNLDIEQLDIKEAREALSGFHVNQLPGVPAILSKKECAAVLGVSLKVINKLTETAHLPLTEIPDDNSPISYNLFGQPITQPHIECILRADLVDFLEKALLCHKPILDPEIDH